MVGHHPVFNAAHHGDTALLVDTLRPILETHQVQLYLLERYLYLLHHLLLLLEIH